MENWREVYLKLIKELQSKLSNDVKKDVFFEVIFMTYSYVHTKINEAVFPNAIQLYDKNIMKGRGKGKYWYKEEVRREGKNFFIENLNKYFPGNEIVYIV